MKQLKSNMGRTDKIIRFLIGMIIAILGIYYKSWWGLLAIIPFLTAFSGRCLLYYPFGISTRSRNKEEQQPV
jgi:hypothetical protein